MDFIGVIIGKLRCRRQSLIFDEYRQCYIKCGIIYDK